MSKNDKPSTDLELVPWEGCDKPIPAFLTKLPWAQTDDDAVQEIVARILGASTVEEVIARAESVKFETLYGSVITVHAFRMMPSAIETGVGAYALIDYTEDGRDEHKVTTTSALGVLAQLARTWQLGGFPLRCAVMEIDTGKNGKSNPVYLAPASQGEEAF